MGDLALFRGRGDREPLMRAGKPLALLAYLGMAANRRVPRDRIAELFWPGVPEPEARHSLRQCRYRLRSATGSGGLLRLSGPDLELVGSIEFDCLVGEAATRPRDAYELLSGNFLEGFAVPGSREFEEWAETQRSRFRDRWYDAGLNLAQECRAGGELAEARGIAEELAQVRPFDDEVVALLMRCFAEEGRHAQALSRYAAFVDAMEAQGDEPDEALERYADELRAWLRSRVGRETVLPFVGRETEWGAVERAVAAAASSSGRFLLIEGAAGTGKTRLLDELRRRATAGSAVLLASKCYEPEQSIPYAAIVGALEGAVEYPALERLAPAWRGELVRLLPALEDRFGAGSGSRSGERETSRQRLHQAIDRLVRVLSENSTVLLTVDDVHWADAASLETLHYLAHRIGGSRVLVAASYRPADLRPESTRFARSLAGSGLAGLVTLGPLSVAAIEDLLLRVAPFQDAAMPAASVAEQLHAHSGGNPLFLSELLDHLSRERALYVEAGRWVLGAQADERPLPQTLARLVGRRLEALPPRARALLEVLAIAADDLSVESGLLQLVEPSPVRLELSLKVLEEERLVRRVSARVVALLHDEVRRIVHESIPDPRRESLHAFVADGLEADGAAMRAGGAARLAYHFQAARNAERATHYALRAEREANVLAAPEEAELNRKVAEAHSRRLLPPGMRRTGERPSRSRRAALVTVAAVILAMAAAAIGLPVTRRDYRQGALFLTSPITLAPTHRIVWPVRRGGAPVFVEATLDAGPPALFYRPVSANGETHTKIFRVAGSDTVQITFGNSDEALPTWAPDGRSVLALSGWREGDRFRNVVLQVSLDGETVRRITDTSWQDTWFSVAPLGPRIAFNRDSLGTSAIWLADFDGRLDRNLTDRYGLPPRRAKMTFSPDGGSLAITYNDDGTGSASLYVLRLQTGSVLKLLASAQAGLTSAPAWSPDGRWLVFSRPGASGSELIAAASDGSREPVILGAVPADVIIGPWLGDRGPPPHVASIEIRSSAAPLRQGERRRLTARVARSDGVVILDEALRWTSSDPRVVRVDGTGLVVGRAPGHASIIASAGGWRADTALIAVSAAPIDTLLVEDWSRGLGAHRWLLFGEPEPVLVSRPDAPGTAFLTNGDYNHGSGAVSMNRFDGSDGGWTVEAEARVALTGDHWQNWQLLVMNGPPRFFAGRELRVEGSVAQFGIDGDMPVNGEARWVCGSGMAITRGTWPGSPEWRRFAIQLREDGRVECFEDGVLLGGIAADSTVDLSELAVVLRGQSVGTLNLHGTVTVTKGLRY